MKQRVVLSVEQALTMTYATLRMKHLGWRVIRIEPTPVPGRKSKGDPNRYIGRPVAGDDRHSYFISPNLGKEAVAINLKEPEGQAILHRMVEALGADVFCTNTMPARHKQLGFDYETLSAIRKDLVWCSVSAMGTKYPEVPGYDPVFQALCGYMDLTGYRDGPPLQCGPPIIDLKAGDEAFTQVILALMEHEESGKGKMIDISMAQVAVSWLHTFLPMLDMGSPPSEIKRSGNEHRQFIPVNAYRTKDGYIFMAIGSDAMWHRFTKQTMFASLEQERFGHNEGRRKDRKELHAAIEEIMMQYPTAEVNAVLNAATVPHSPITPIEEVPDLPFVADTALKTTMPDGRPVRLPPPPLSTDYLEELGGELPFAPSYGEHTDSILGEIGLGDAEIASLRENGVVA